MNLLSPMRSLGLAFLLTLAAPVAFATDCNQWQRFRSSESYLAPLSVAPGKIGKALTDDPHAMGVVYSSQMKGRDLWIDVTDFPGTTSAAVAPASIFKAGRLADEGFDRLVLADGGTGLFTLSEPELRLLGCQFIWGREGGENPIHLMREMYARMRDYDSGNLLTTGFTGHLLGDTGLAMRMNNEVLLPKWVISAVK